MRNAMLLMTPLFLLALVAGAFAPRAQACIWDYDTLAIELKGLPAVRDVAVGVFDRFPAKYYEMRIERLSKLLENTPHDLDALDSIAVAYDRIGESTKAIEWMAVKKAALDARDTAEASKSGDGDGSEDSADGDAESADVDFDRYRYLANLGTFYAHRWVKSANKFDDMKDLDSAIEYISAAIEENPDAHFGREVYQLKALEWLRDTAAAGYDAKLHKMLPDMLGLSAKRAFHSTGDNEKLKEFGLEDSIEGLTGIIVQGAAWQSVDVFYALYLALITDGKHSAALYVMQRIKELVDDGKGSIIKGAPTGAALIKAMSVYSLVDDPDQVTVRSDYKKMRAWAKDWQEARENFMAKQFAAGKHPDSDEDFWSDFEAPERPELAGENQAKSDANKHGSPAEGEDAPDSDSPRRSRNSDGAWGAEEDEEDERQKAQGSKRSPQKQSPSDAQEDREDRRESEKAVRRKKLGKSGE